MSHAMLLRLFLSPSFFSIHVALQYMRLYSDNIGITYYLTRRLREFDTHELEEVWGFICHLLVTRPSHSRALECFVSEVAERSTHVAMQTLWFMQAYLKEFSSRPDSASFTLCQRTMHRCHEIIFSDLSSSSTSPYAIARPSFGLLSGRRKVKHQVEPALVGLGLVLAGTPAVPELTKTLGEVVIDQGRTDDRERGISTADDLITPTKPARKASNDSDQESEDEPEPSVESPLPISSAVTLTQFSPNVGKQHTKSLDHKARFDASRTAPSLPLHLRDMRRSRLSDDPLGQLDQQETKQRADTVFSSTPSIGTPPSGHQIQPSLTEERLLQLDPQLQVHMLRSHYCRAEVHFLMTLESVSDRLLIVPRPARVSALRAELTALNHKLPAEVCMPMWCRSSDSVAGSNGIPQPHHRIVRIPPGECVVLNSAERAPYVLLIEVLHDDLDFDPLKRGNKDILKKMVDKESRRKGTSQDVIPFNSPAIISRRKLVDRLSSKHSSFADSDANGDLDGAIGDVSIPTTPSTANLDAEEEVDLVEQVYGSDKALRSRHADLSESIVLPAPPKNRDLDMAAWSRTPALSMPSTPGPAVIASLSSPTAEFMPSPLPQSMSRDPSSQGRILTLDDYSERMRTAAVMLAQLTASVVREPVTTVRAPSVSSNVDASVLTQSAPSTLSWIPGSTWLSGNKETAAEGGPLHPSLAGSNAETTAAVPTRMKVKHSEAAAIRDRIMKEMLSLEEERMGRMRESNEDGVTMKIGDLSRNMRTTEDENIIRRELSRADPSAVVFSESWSAKKSRIRHASPYGHLANWDCVSVIVKTGGDLRQEQLAVQLIQEFERIWREEKCDCWVRYFRILITGATSGLVETITDAVSIHSIKKAEYARRLAEGRLGHVTLLDHFKNTYGDPSSAKFARAQRNFAASLAGYSIVTYVLQIKDRHNGNILLDRDGHIVHIDFGFMLSNSPGNIGFEAAPFKLPLEYVEVLGGVEGAPFLEFRRLFREGFEAARKHCDRIIALVEIMQKDSALPCFAAFGEQTAALLRDRFQPALTHSLVEGLVDRLIDTSLGSNYTRLYDSFQYYSQSIL